MVVSLSQLSADEFEAVSLSIESAVQEEVLVYVQPQDSFRDVIGMVRNNFPLNEGQSQEFRINFAVNGSVVQAKAVQVANTARDYSAGLSTVQQEDIRYILKTLSNSSILKIGASESSLKKAGERIDAVHPLRFLEYVFTDEELKVCMHNMHGRSWVWKEFISGIIGSFNEEYARGNIKADQIANFIKTLKITPSLINSSIQNQRWTDLIDTLIAKIPREQGSDRYNM